MNSLVPSPPLISPLSPNLSCNTGRTFSQIPFVRLSERIEKGVRVRKQYRKYLEHFSLVHRDYGQQLQHENYLTSMMEEMISSSCLTDAIECMKRGNLVNANARIDLYKEVYDRAQVFDHASRIKKWNINVYNILQKMNVEISSAEKKMTRGILRLEKAKEGVEHWKRMLASSEATLCGQPNNVECQRSVQLAISKSGYASEELIIAASEYSEVKSVLQVGLSKRDTFVKESTEWIERVEKDRLDAIIDSLKLLVDKKKQVLETEKCALDELERVASTLNSSSVLQQFISKNSLPESTHSQTKALQLLEWHRNIGHYEQVKLAATVDTLPGQGITQYDVYVMKDFIASCFTDPDRNGIPISIRPKHRARFITNEGAVLYTLPKVRHILLERLNGQRARSQELTTRGYDHLATALTLMLDACQIQKDISCTKNLMNMIQTFYKSPQIYLTKCLQSHTVFGSPAFWGNSLLISIREEMSKSNLEETPWYHLDSNHRQQLVMSVHNIIFGHLGSLVCNMGAFGCSKTQIQQFARSVADGFDLAEDQLLTILKSIDTMSDIGSGQSSMDGTEAAHFTTSVLLQYNEGKPPELVKASVSYNPFSRIIGIFDTSPMTSQKNMIETNAQNTTSSTQILTMENKIIPTAVLIASEEPYETPSGRNRESALSWEELFGANEEKKGNASLNTLEGKKEAVRTVSVHERTTSSLPSRVLRKSHSTTIPDASSRKKSGKTLDLKARGRSKSSRSPDKPVRKASPGSVQHLSIRDRPKISVTDGSLRPMSSTSKSKNGEDLLHQPVTVRTVSAQLATTRSPPNAEQGVLQSLKSASSSAPSVEKLSAPPLSGVAALRARFEKK